MVFEINFFLCLKENHSDGIHSLMNWDQQQYSLIGMVTQMLVNFTFDAVKTINIHFY
jgi:hypothetical protein